MRAGDQRPNILFIMDDQHRFDFLPRSATTYYRRLLRPDGG